MATPGATIDTHAVPTPGGIDCRPDLEAQGRAAMKTVTSSFNWR